MIERAESRAFALAAAELAANTRCEDVVLLDLRGRSPVTDFFVIATGTSPRQMRTVVDEVADLGRRMGYAPWKMEGYESARWIVMDCVSVVVHVLDGESREFYDLELLWGEESAQVNWRKELGLPPAPPVTVAVPASEAGRMRHGLLEEVDEEAEEQDVREVEATGGDADLDEEAETDAPVITEVAEEEQEGVKFVEIDPPAGRGRRGKTVFPVRVDEDEDVESAVHVVDARSGEQAEELAEEEQKAGQKRPKVVRKRAARKLAKKPAARKPAKKPAKKPARRKKKR